METRGLWMETFWKCNFKEKDCIEYDFGSFFQSMLLRIETRFFARFALKFVKFKKSFWFGLGYQDLNNSDYDKQSDSKNDSEKSSGDDTSWIKTVFSDMIGNQDTFLPTLQNIFMKVTKVHLNVDGIVTHDSYLARQARFLGFYYCYERPARFWIFTRQFSLYGD